MAAKIAPKPPKTPDSAFQNNGMARGSTSRNRDRQKPIICSPIASTAETDFQAAVVYAKPMGKGQPAQKVAGASDLRQTACEFNWSKSLPGFGIRTLKSGRQVYVVQYRERKRTRRRTIGEVGRDDQRAMRREAQRLLAIVGVEMGVVDPFALPVAASRGTVAQYVERFWNVASLRWKPTTQTTNRKILTDNILPVFGDTAIADIDRPMVMRWRDDMADRPGVANRSLPVLSAMLKCAEAHGIRKKGSNPAARMTRFPMPPKMRFLSLSEVQRLGEALATYETDFPAECDAIRILLLTGARRGEVLTMRFDMIDGKFLHLPDSKTGESTRYLGRSARTILERRRCAMKVEAGASAFVFASPGATHPLKPFDPLWRQIRSDAGLEGVRLHDLRHSFASHGAMNGVTLPTLSRLLGHRLLESTEVYAHLSNESLRDAASRVSGAIARMSGFRYGEAA